MHDVREAGRQAGRQAGRNSVLVVVVRVFCSDGGILEGEGNKVGTLVSGTSDLWS